jgi:hypothetical protein
MLNDVAQVMLVLADERLQKKVWYPTNLKVSRQEPRMTER